MANTGTIRSQIKDYLGELEPLAVVTLEQLYQLPGITAAERPSVRAAIYGLCAGTPVSESNKPSTYYGIRLKLRNGMQVILSLPGIPRDMLMKDHASNETNEQIIKRLQKRYGVEAINYWGKSAQHRSVVQAAKGMKTAKSRDLNRCKLCEQEGASDQKNVSACHIISRKTLFWKSLDEVEKINNTIFSEKATLQLQEKLKNDELHSSSKYIVTLCCEHNKMLLQALQQSLSQQQSEKEFERESPLFCL